MKTKSRSRIEMVRRLYDIRESMKELAREESELRNEIKNFMGSDSVLDAGDYAVLISNRTRHDLDKGLLIHDIGYETIKKYMKSVTYAVIEIKTKAVIC